MLDKKTMSELAYLATIVKKAVIFFPKLVGRRRCLCFPFFFFRCLLTTCFDFIIHQSMPDLIRIAAVCLIRGALWRLETYGNFSVKGKCLFYVLAPSLFGFRCLLTICFAIIIHQSLQNSIRIVRVTFDLHS